MNAVNGPTLGPDLLVATHLRLDDLIFAATRRLTHEQLADFIVDLDARVADYDFTKNLIARLQGELDKEEGD